MESSSGPSREVVRVATQETEREWAELCAKRTYAEIKDLVEKYPKYAQEILGIVGQYEKTYK